ncbi:MAG: KTSC domain-containing protein [Polyangiales bacterium]
MQRTPVTSRAITSVGYDASTLELEIEFRGGRVYRYRGVPGDVHQFLLRTRDKGSYVNRVIAKAFAYSEHQGQAAEQDLVAALEASLRRER